MNSQEDELGTAQPQLVYNIIKFRVVEILRRFYEHLFICKMDKNQDDLISFWYRHVLSHNYKYHIYLLVSLHFHDENILV